MFTNSENYYSFDNKNFIIIILLFILFLTFLGINLLTTTDNILKMINNTFSPFFYKVLAFFGSSTGNIINGADNVLTKTGQFGLNVASGAVHDVGDLFIKSTRESFDNKVNNSRIKINVPEADTTEDPIQNSISSSKNSLLNNGFSYTNIEDNNLITIK